MPLYHKQLLAYTLANKLTVRLLNLPADAKLGMEAIRAAGFFAAVDVTRLEGYPHLV